MPIIYKIDVLSALKEKGYNTTKLRKDKLLGESTIQQLRENKLVSWANMERLCSLLDCQVGDLLEFVPEPEVEEQSSGGPYEIFNNDYIC